MGRLRFLNFASRSDATDPEMVLENQLFQGKITLELEGLDGLFLKFYGDRPINLETTGSYVEERLI